MSAPDASRAPGQGRPEDNHHDNRSAVRRVWQAVVSWCKWADPLGILFAAAIAGLALLLVAGLAR